MSTRTVVGAESAEGRVNASTVLVGILVAGFLVRMLLIGSEGYRGDVSSFMSWALTAAQHPLSEFYARAGFADYPPGYLFVLWIAGHLYLLLPHANGDYGLLHFLVKLPACLFDIVNGCLIWAIVRRFTTQAWANAAAAIYVLNPATIYISAYWGQVDAVPAAFMLAAVALLLRSTQATRRLFVVGAWVCVAYAILIKPPALMVALIMLAWAFVPRDAEERTKRMLDTALGIVAGLALAFIVALVFHPSFTSAIPWLLERYAYGSAVYPYNSINAFNLHSLFRPFWQPDTGQIVVGGLNLGAMWLWGIILVGAAAALIVARYLQRGYDVAFVEAAMLVSLAFFVLATRMHERYIFNAFALMVPLVAIDRRYRIPMAAISLTLLANLWYSLYYARAMEAKLPVNATDIFPLLTHPMSLINVAVFFVLGYVYLGGKVGAEPKVSARSTTGLRERT
ncbi:MAG: glycosyltransferase family 39 protein, partial [Polyangiaceae bacterium]